MDIRRVEICGIPVDCIDPADAISRVEGLLHQPSPAVILAVNPEKVVRAGRDPRLKSALCAATMLIPDGIGVVLAAKVFWGARISRVPGCELMPSLCSYAADHGLSVFLFGAAPGVAECAAAALRASLPNLRVAGCHHGHLQEKDSAAVIARINEARPDFLFVALGSPKQEFWIAENLKKLNIKVCQGVGGTFDVLAGNSKRAPRFFRKLQLEWFFRLVTEPRRASRQIALPIFAGRVLRDQTLRLLHLG